MYSQFPISSRTALIFGLFSRQLKDDMAEVWKTSATMASRDPPTVGYPPQAALQTFVDDWTRRWIGLGLSELPLSYRDQH